MRQLSIEEIKEIGAGASEDVVKCVENMIDILGWSVENAMDYCARSLPRD
jgi:hypothetical protein